MNTSLARPSTAVRIATSVRDALAALRVSLRHGAASIAARRGTAATALGSIVAGLALLTACGGNDDASIEPVTVTPVGPNAVSYWNEVASATVNLPATTTGTAEEQRPFYAADLATVHVAVYDAVMAIVGSHRPYAITPASATAGASQEAAIASAAYRVLLGLFPSRTAQYQSAYDRYLATLPAGDAKTQGVAIGAEAAAGILALRANDGRAVVLATYVPGTAPGQFRGLNPINRYFQSIKPFAIDTNRQFRVPPPPALDSAAYAADLNETQALGSATSTTRNTDQTALARFGTEPPPNYWENNMRVFATTGRSLAEHARLMALIWVAHADASDACFESKYAYERWRPTSAITSPTPTATRRPRPIRPGPPSFRPRIIRNTRPVTAA